MPYCLTNKILNKRNTELRGVNDVADATDSWQSLAAFTQHPYRFSGTF